MTDIEIKNRFNVLTWAIGGVGALVVATLGMVFAMWQAIANLSYQLGIVRANRIDQPCGTEMTDKLTRESWEITSREAWAERRGKDITASNIGALFEGANPYSGIDDLVAHVSGKAVRRDTPAMRAGRLLEGIFPEAIAEQHSEWLLEKALTYHRIPELRLGGTPDYWRYRLGDKDLCECKAPSEHQWNDVWRGVPPLYINLQVQTQMLVTGAESAVIAVIVRSSELPLHLFEVEAHTAAQAKILAAVAQFWKRYDAGEFPVAGSSDEIAAMLDDGSHRDLSDDPHLPEWLEKRETMVANRTWAEREIKGIDYVIKQRMGKASTAWLPGWQISWKSQHRKEFTVPAKDIRVLRVQRTEGRTVEGIPGQDVDTGDGR